MKHSKYTNGKPSLRKLFHMHFLIGTFSTTSTSPPQFVPRSTSSVALRYELKQLYTLFSPDCSWNYKLLFMQRR